MPSGRSSRHRLGVCVGRYFGGSPTARIGFWGNRREISATRPNRRKSMKVGNWRPSGCGSFVCEQTQQLILWFGSVPWVCRIEKIQWIVKTDCKHSICGGCSYHLFMFRGGRNLTTNLIYQGIIVERHAMAAKRALHALDSIHMHVRSYSYTHYFRSFTLWPFIDTITYSGW